MCQTICVTGLVDPLKSVKSKRFKLVKESCNEIRYLFQSMTTPSYKYRRRHPKYDHLDMFPKGLKLEIHFL